jgi:dTDP-4-dehydrorhamnose reductase
MHQRRVLITGGSGLLALNWAVSLRDKSDVVLCFHERVVNLAGVTTTVCALDSVSQIVECLKQEKPDIVIHTAGLTSVEKCEENPELAEYINVTIAKNVAAACAAENIQLVHISTDHLFDGVQSLLSEEENPSSVNIYGLTKARAEEAVYAENQKALIIRTNFFGWGTKYRKSFSDFVVDALRNKQPIQLFDDVFYTPIHAGCLSQITHALLEKGAIGVFNVVGDERITKYNFGRKLADRFELDASLIKRSKILDKHNLVERPMDMSLSNSKVCAYLNRVIGGVDEQLDMLCKQETDGIAAELKQL